VRVRRLMTEQTSLGTGGVTLDLASGAEHMEYGIAQVKLTGSASVQIRGRTHIDMEWEVIQTFGADSGIRVTLFPLMEAFVSSYSSGACTVDLVF
jgi:hypothetical protein